ncbi:MAG: CRISPR-associated helicase Cas3' [Armatimonadetes bacterium]|nr:CRISPR-associated helicase Cas3' [Armatimonadota bacterium]MBX3107831.1 CRISPR-associated helicase Cas3' [Fimbriimonadaceae bacterium]
MLWAKSKPYHPLWKHLLDAAAVSLCLANPLAKWGWTPEQVALIVGLHDIGKADAGFQHQVAELSGGLTQAGFLATADVRCRHEKLSAKFVRSNLKESGCSERDADTIGRAILAHHGYWEEVGVGAPYKDAQHELYQLLKGTLGLNELHLPVIEGDGHSAFGTRLAGHIVLCDWIASNEQFYLDDQLKEIDNPVEYLMKAREVAAAWVLQLDLVRKQEDGKPSDVVGTPRPLQKALVDSDIPPSLVIIEAPMGEGKTEAAWILAEKWRKYGYHGVFMALPTMATSDSLFRRYKDDYLKNLGRDEGTHLIHGMAWLRDDVEPENPPNVGEPGDDRSLAAAWFRPTRRAMLAAHGVGTVDQAMLAGMHVKFGFLRLFGLADRVLVIDEVHAYDAYMSAIICRLLQWCACLKIPVVLLSATLSTKQRNAMIKAYGAMGGGIWPEAPYPLITIAQPGESVKTIEPRASSLRTLNFVTHSGQLNDAKATATLAKSLVQSGGCCCVILNTVKQAQAVYAALDTEVPKLLFHARFTAEDRERIASKVIQLFGKERSNRPEKFILVATQVVEQSLDVDFDHMISEIAPMDLLLQRSGRLHRHRMRKDEPLLHVLTPSPDLQDFGGTGYVYAEKPLFRTVAILSGTCQAELPRDFRQLVERTYGSEIWDCPNTDWPEVRRADLAWDKETALEEASGAMATLNEPSRRIFRPINNTPAGDDSDDGNGWRAKTRLGASDRTTILASRDELPRLEAGKLRVCEVKEAYRRAVKTARYLPLHSPCDGHGGAVEGNERMRGVLLLPLDATGAWKGSDKNGNVYCVSYDAELGLLAGRER